MNNDDNDSNDAAANQCPKQWRPTTATSAIHIVRCERAIRTNANGVSFRDLPPRAVSGVCRGAVARSVVVRLDRIDRTART